MTLHIYIGDGTWPDLYPLTLTSPTARPVSSTASFTDLLISEDSLIKPQSDHTSSSEAFVKWTASFTDLLHNASSMTQYTTQQENHRTDGDHLCSKVHLSRTEPDRPASVVHRVFH